MLAVLAESDHRSVLGKNFGALRRELSTEEITPQIVKNNVKYFATPDEQMWRIDLLQELFEVRLGQLQMNHLPAEEVISIINILCTT